MPLLLVVLIVVVSFSSIGSGVSALMVDVDVDRPPREFFRGPRWVSLNSVRQSVLFHDNMILDNSLFVRFQDMLPTRQLIGMEEEVVRSYRAVG
jgi:hypothetical protein